MSIEAYEEMAGKLDLYGLMKEGIEDIKQNNTIPFETVIDEIKAKKE